MIFKRVDIEAEILRRINEKSRLVQPFNVLVNPTADVPEQQKLTLVVLHPQYRADVNNIAENHQNICRTNLPRKRVIANASIETTILFLGPTDYVRGPAGCGDKRLPGLQENQRGLQFPT